MSTVFYKRMLFGAAVLVWAVFFVSMLGGFGGNDAAQLL